MHEYANLWELISNGLFTFNWMQCLTLLACFRLTRISSITNPFSAGWLCSIFENRNQKSNGRFKIWRNAQSAFTCTTIRLRHSALITMQKYFREYISYVMVDSDCALCCHVKCSSMQTKFSLQCYEWEKKNVSCTKPILSKYFWEQKRIIWIYFFHYFEAFN